MDCLLYIKATTANPPFWGVTYNVLDYALEAKQRPLLVLLYHTRDDRCAGYLLTKSAIVRDKEHWCPGKSAFVVHASSGLHHATEFRSFDQFLELLMRSASKPLSQSAD